MELPGMRAFLDRLPALSRVALQLDRERSARIPELLAAHEVDVQNIGEGLEDLLQGPEFVSAHVVDEATARLLAAHRGYGGKAGVGTRVDAWLQSDEEEILDTDQVPDEERERVMGLLHRFNERIGSYRQFGRAVDAALGDRDPAHVYDLAAGTGGFLLHLAAEPPSSRRLRLTSSDIDAGYVAMGAERARDDGLDVRFEVHDALALGDVRGVDLFVCTQASHHLPPGMVLRMIHQAVHAAPRGIVIIDVLRGLSAYVGTAMLVSLVEPDSILLRDGLQSIRRGWLPGELELFARLAGATHVDSRPLGPAHCALHAMGF